MQVRWWVCVFAHFDASCIGQPIHFNELPYLQKLHKRSASTFSKPHCTKSHGTLLPWFLAWILNAKMLARCIEVPLRIFACVSALYKCEPRLRSNLDQVCYLCRLLVGKQVWGSKASQCVGGAQCVYCIWGDKRPQINRVFYTGPWVNIF